MPAPPPFRWLVVPIVIAMLSGCVIATSTSTRVDQADAGAAAGIPPDAAAAALYMDAQERDLRNRFSDSIVSVERMRTDIVLTIAGPAAFRSDHAELNPDLQTVLGVLAEVLNTYDGTVIEVSGFTDASGPMIGNLQLSLERAESVTRTLAELGVQAERLVARGLGPMHPIADNETPEGRQLNRRVELTIRPLSGKTASASAAPQ
jgi:outer membrane protein OmpA-like peptidoglycan-associated protein